MADERLRNYRRTLVSAGQTAQSDWDKTLLTLAGGALGVSFAFVNTFLGDSQVIKTWVLMGAWELWAATLLFVLFSFIASRQAIRSIVGQIDTATSQGKSDIPHNIGKGWSYVTEWCNTLGVILFVAGVLMIIFFINVNWPPAAEVPIRSGLMDNEQERSVEPDRIDPEKIEAGYVPPPPEPAPPSEPPPPPPPDPPPAPKPEAHINLYR